MSNLLFNKFFQNLGNAEDLPTDNPLKNMAEMVIKTFDEIVDYHRSAFPNPDINALMSLFWRLVGNKVTPTVLTNQELFGLHFYCEVHDGSKVAAVIVPCHWLKLVIENSIMQCGGVIFIASQAQDYYNEQYGSESMTMRARVYEAEFLKTILNIIPNHKLNDYQIKVLEAFPQGLDSLPDDLKYDGKPFDPTTPQSRINNAQR